MTQPPPKNPKIPVNPLPDPQTSKSNDRKSIEEITEECLKRVRETLIGYVFDFPVDEIPADFDEEKFENSSEGPSTSKKSQQTPKLLQVSEMLNRNSKVEVFDEDDELFEKEDAKIKPKVRKSIVRESTSSWGGKRDSRISRKDSINVQEPTRASTSGLSGRRNSVGIKNASKPPSRLSKTISNVSKDIKK